MSQGDIDGQHWLELRFGHNCWKHDEDLTIRYSGVRYVFPAMPPARVG